MLKQHHKYNYIKLSIFKTLYKEVSHIFNTISASELLKKKIKN